MKMTLPGLRTIAEAAERLGVQRATAYGWASTGQLPTVRLGRRTVRVREADLQRIEREGLPVPAAASAA